MFCYRFCLHFCTCFFGFASVVILSVNFILGIILLFVIQFRNERISRIQFSNKNTYSENGILLGEVPCEQRTRKSGPNTST